MRIERKDDTKCYWSKNKNKNKNIIKLPEKDFLKSLENFIHLTENLDYEKYKIFDYRIPDQLILN